MDGLGAEQETRARRVGRHEEHRRKQELQEPREPQEQGGRHARMENHDGKKDGDGVMDHEKNDAAVRDDVQDEKERGVKTEDEVGERKGVNEDGRSNRNLKRDASPIPDPSGKRLKDEGSERVSPGSTKELPHNDPSERGVGLPAESRMKNEDGKGGGLEQGNAKVDPGRKPVSTAIEVGIAEDKGTRHAMEDAWTVMEDYFAQESSKTTPNYSRFSFYAIFDGHGGRRAALFAKNNMHKYVFRNECSYDKVEHKKFRKEIIDGF